MLCLAKRSFLLLCAAALFLSHGYGIVSALAERIAAQYAPYGERAASDKAPFAERLDRVLRAGRCKAAARTALQRRDILSVEGDQKYEKACHIQFSFASGMRPVFDRQYCKSRFTSCILRTVALSRQTMTQSQPLRTQCSASIRRYASRTTRFARFRATAPPIFFEADIPTRFKNFFSEQSGAAILENVNGHGTRRRAFSVFISFLKKVIFTNCSLLHRKPPIRKNAALVINLRKAYCKVSKSGGRSY